MATKLQHRLYDVMARAEEGDYARCAFDVGLLTLIMLNVAAVVLDTVPTISEIYRAWFDWFEIISMVIFTAGYLLRL